MGRMPRATGALPMPFDDLVDHAVAAGGHNGLVALVDGALGLRLGVAGAAGGLDDGLGRHFLEAPQPGFRAAGGVD